MLTAAVAPKPVQTLKAECCIRTSAMGDGDTETETESGDDAAPLDRTVERAFTCSVCGFAMTHEVPLLQVEVQSVCFNCGDWTNQTARLEELVDAAEAAAAELADGLLTERQALAYLLRDVVGVDRQATADAMDSTPSNVDNLQRRASEKVEQARTLVEGIDALDVSVDASQDEQAPPDESAGPSGANGA